jgi:tetratricopeptide (TPR) repeat protein
MILAVAGLRMALDHSRDALLKAEQLKYVPKGEFLRVAVLGYRQLAADLLWLKAIQNFGGRTQTIEGYRAGYHAVDVLTDLDPEFSFSYQVAGTVLGIWAGLADESVAILTKGIKSNPNVWQLPFFLGYDYYYELHNPTMAARYFRLASTIPGAPAYLPNLAARMTVEAGDPSAALEFLDRLYQTTQDERIRGGLLKRMREVMVERDVRQLQSAIQTFKEQRGAMPGSLHALVHAGFLKRVPEEPHGGRYVYDPGTGSVHSSMWQERMRVHRKSQ